MLWEHESQASVSTGFSSSPITFTFITSTARASSVFLSSYSHPKFLTNHHAYFLRTVF